MQGKDTYNKKNKYEREKHNTALRERRDKQ